MTDLYKGSTDFVFIFLETPGQLPVVTNILQDTPGQSR